MRWRRLSDEQETVGRIYRPTLWQRGLHPHQAATGLPQDAPEVAGAGAGDWKGAEVTNPRSYTDEWHDMVALCKAQSEALEKCQQERDDAWLALRAVIGILEGNPIYRPVCELRELEILAIAKATLKEAREEAE